MEQTLRHPMKDAELYAHDWDSYFEKDKFYNLPTPTRREKSEVQTHVSAECHFECDAPIRKYTRIGFEVNCAQARKRDCLKKQILAKEIFSEITDSITSLNQ